MTIFTRLIIYCTILILVSYDVTCMLVGWPTISSQIRWLDEETSGLMKWLLFGIWLHLFIPMWKYSGGI